MIDRIKELESLITKYATSYYSGESDVSDEYFDSLVDELRTLNPDSEVLKKTGWGFSPSGSKKVKHLYGMHVGSLSKIHSASEFPERMIPSKDGEFCRVSAKLDGLSVVSYYSAGKRVLAVTRGNGEEGKDVTQKMRVIDPSTDELFFGFTGAVRGEVLIDNRTWDRIKDRYGDNPSANQRNVAAGIMNRNDNEDQVDEDLKLLRYVVYKVVACEDVAYDGGFSIPLTPDEFSKVPYVRLFKENFEIDIDSQFETLLEKFREDFPCDGLVLTKNYCTQTDKGEIVYDEVAYKFQAESKEVVVKEVTWSATRTGRVIPVVWFDPVPLSGALVQKATGFNARFILDNKIKKGVKILVTRSGEVIPHIMKVLG